MASRGISISVFDFRRCSSGRLWTTELGRAAAEAYALRKGVSTEAFLAGFGSPLSARAYGEHVTTVLTDPQYESAPAFVIRGDTRIQPLDA